MVLSFLRCAGLRLAVAALSGICVTAVGRAIGTASRAAQDQQPGQVQTGPITEPRGAVQRPGGPPVVKGIQAIAQRDAKCSKRLVVNAEALFGPDRWTLNPDAAETLDALAPLITKAGKHPVRIEAFTDSAASPSDNQTVAEKRAITVRGWLTNHGYVAQNTPVQGFDTGSAVTSKSDGLSDPESRHEKQRVEVVIDTCK